MPFSKQVLAECEMIDARRIFIMWELCGGDSLPYGGGHEIIAELETYKVRLDNILGDTDKKEQDHLHKSSLDLPMSFNL